MLHAAPRQLQPSRAWSHDALHYCQTPDLPILPSPAIDLKIWKALYLRGCLSAVMLATALMLLWPFKMLKLSP